MKFEIRKAVTGEYYWVAIAPNGEPLATSELYTRKESAQAGIASLTAGILAGEVETFDVS